MLILILAVYFDTEAFRAVVPALLVSQYFCPLMLAIFTLYFNPQLQLLLTNWEYNERKSLKENSFLSKVNFSLVFNMIFGPFLITLLINFIDHHDDARFNLQNSLLECLQVLEGFYTRFFV